MPNDSLPNEPSQELSKDDILEDLMAEETPAEETKVEEPEAEVEPEIEPEPEEEEKIELKEEEPEEEPKEEDLELVIPVRRKEIIAKYPNLFKDFPYLERAYYREQQYTEIFPTLDDAKLAVEKSQVLDKFEKDVFQGNTESVLRAVKQSDDKSFAKLVDNYLPTLAKVDEQAYYHVVGNIIRTAVNHMTREGQRLGENGEPLKIAAQLVNQFVFGTTELAEPTNLAKPTEPNSESDRLRKEREAFVKEKFTAVHTDLTTKVQNVLKSTINNHIDPKQSMTEYVRKTATRDAYESLEQLMAQDSRFRTILDKLWEKAFEDNFSPKSLERIRSAYLSKAKTVLPNVIKKSRNDALKGLGRKTDDDRDKRGPLPVGRTSSDSKSAKSSTKEIPKGMKTIDYLMQD